MDKRKISKIILIILSAGLVISAIATATLALFTNDEYAANTETYSTGVLSIEAHSKSETISLTNALPMTNEEGRQTKPYVFTIRNTGNLDYEFDVKLLSINNNPFSSTYINVEVNDGRNSRLSAITNGEIISDLVLAAGEYIDISIRLWLDIDTPNSEIGKSFECKIVTDGHAVPNRPNTLMTTNTRKGVYLRSDLERTLISSITFVDNNNVPDYAIKSFDVSYSMDGTVMMWYGAVNSRGLYDVYIGSSNGTTIISSGSGLFGGLSNATSINLSNVDTSKTNNMQLMFSSCSNLTTLDLSNFNTENVTVMYGMFYDCNKLETINLSNFDTKKVNAMNSMFARCNSLTNLDVSNFNTSNVTTTRQMFYRCYLLTSLDLSGWDVSNVTDMSGMFSTNSVDTNMSIVSFGDISKWNVSKVKDMSGMFYSCTLLETLDIVDWDVSKVENFSAIFENCTALKEIDISGWNTNSATNMSYMFEHCSNLVTIYVSPDKWTTKNVTNSYNMFYFCTSLKGGLGTTYNDSFLDIKYAHVDEGATNPGYLTSKV